MLAPCSLWLSRRSSIGRPDKTIVTSLYRARLKLTAECSAEEKRQAIATAGQQEDSEAIAWLRSHEASHMRTAAVTGLATVLHNYTAVAALLRFEACGYRTLDASWAG